MSVYAVHTCVVELWPPFEHTVSFHLLLLPLESMLLIQLRPLPLPQPALQAPQLQSELSSHAAVIWLHEHNQAQIWFLIAHINSLGRASSCFVFRLEAL